MADKTKDEKQNDKLEEKIIALTASGDIRWKYHAQMDFLGYIGSFNSKKICVAANGYITDGGLNIIFFSDNLFQVVQAVENKRDELDKLEYRKRFLSLFGIE